MTGPHAGVVRDDHDELMAGVLPTLTQWLVDASPAVAAMRHETDAAVVRIRPVPGAWSP
ncbi:MAG: hypothetical protein ACRCZP_07625 [Phycicoccus sp.]